MSKGGGATNAKGGMVGDTQRGGGHEAKVTTWHGP